MPSAAEGGDLALQVLADRLHGIDMERDAMFPGDRPDRRAFAQWHAHPSFRR